MTSTHLSVSFGYLTHEIEWRKVEHAFKVDGKSIGHYMIFADRWLGWGVHGARTLLKPVLQSTI